MNDEKVKDQSVDEEKEVLDLLGPFCQINYGNDKVLPVQELSNKEIIDENEEEEEIEVLDLSDDEDEIVTVVNEVKKDESNSSSQSVSVSSNEMKQDQTEIVFQSNDDSNNEEKVSKKKVKKKKNKWKKWVISFAIMDVLAIICLFLTYGPITYFRNLLITTAMTTKSHQYLARIFYDDDTIQGVLASNYVEETGTNTDSTDIVINTVDHGNYDSIYEEQILKRDEGNDLYKIIPISETSYQGYLVAIYDPSRVDLVLSDYFGSSGQFLNTIAVNYEASVAMNASGFVDINERGNGGQPTGSVIKDGELLTPKTSGVVGKLIGFNQDHVLMLMNDTPENAIAQGMVDAVDFGPFLIVNGEAANISGNGGWGIAPRSVIAQRKDGIVLFLVIDGRQPGYSIGASMADVIKILTRYKAHNAANLDGGATSSLNIEGQIYNRPCAISATGERPLPNAWIVK